MYKLKNSIAACLGLCALIGFIAVVMPATGYGSGDGPSAKAVSVTNTPNLQIVNPLVVKSRQEGAWNVGVTGSVGINPQSNSVQIANSPSNPVLTREVGAAATQPFHANLTVIIPGGANLATSTPIIVPAGKRLIVEQVSFRGGVSQPARIMVASLQIHQQGEQFTHYLPFVEEVIPGPGFRRYYLPSQQTRLQLEAGMTLDFFVYIEDGALDQSGLTLTVSGYLVDAP